MTELTLSVPDISCDHCKNAIEGALKPLEGVGSAEVSIPDRTVANSFDNDSITLDTIVEAIGEQGYEVANT
jgi:copper chaperone